MARNSFAFGGIGGISGIALGAGLMYLFDPRSGRRRRAEAMQKAMQKARETTGAAEVVAKDAANRSRGLAHKVAYAVRSDNASDEIICERVRAALGRLTSHPGPIAVTCNRGILTLSGPILEREIPQVLAGLKLVRGVERIENRLDPHRSVEHISALQGGRFQGSPLPGIFQNNWSPSTRFGVGAVGVGLIGYGLVNRGIIGLCCGIAGAGLFARSLTNGRTRRIEGRRAIDVQKSIYISRSPEEVFSFFRRFENFPRFMSHVLDIQQTGDNRWHWRVTGPAHLPIEWDAEVRDYYPNELISWQSVRGAAVKTNGYVRFLRDERGGTRIDVRLYYAPIAGALGHSFAKLFGVDPKKQMDDDLLRLKSLLETGKANGFRQEIPQRRAGEEWQH